jgi:hypothetical protein
MAKGTIKMVIDTNGATNIDMSNFKKCSDKTKELMKNMDMEVETMDLKDEVVENVTTSTNNVNVKR